MSMCSYALYFALIKKLKYITWCNISICASKWSPIGWVSIKKLSYAKVWNM